MRIVLDAMGGDHAPAAPVAGAILAIKDYPEVHIILVGKEEKIQAELDKFDYLQEQITVVNATEIIDMDDAPASAIRKKKDSSIVVAASLVKKGEGDAFISAGNTGACMSAGLLKIGRIKGISRPAIATVIPNVKDATVVLDSGANVDVGSLELEQFALMGKIFAEKVLKKTNPKVGLLNIGEEEHKGNQQTHEAFPHIQKSLKNFIGNVEGRDIFNGQVDVVVCDGFVGNIVLKTTEGLAKTIFTILKEEINRRKISKLGALLMKPALKALKKKLDYTEYGGAPLLGVKGVTIISHGSSNAWAFRNAIRIACESVESNLVNEIATNISKED